MSYPAEVAADSPLSYWRFGQQSAMSSYDVGSVARPALLGIGGGTLSPTHIPDCFTGPVSGGVAVGVINDAWYTWYVNTGGGYQTPCTLEALVWVGGGNVLSASQVGIIGIGTASGSADRVSIGWNGAAFNAWVGGTVNVNGSTSTLQQWHHVAFCCDATSCILYVDGSAAMTHALAIANAAVEQAHLAYNGTAGALLKGFIAEPAIYSTKLSAARIAAHYAAADRMGDLPVKLAAAGSVGPPLSVTYLNAP